MRREHCWAQVLYEEGGWWFHVDPRVFKRLSAEAQLGLMAHELGHAACYRGGDSGYGSEEEADAHATRWGFAAELVALYDSAA